MPWIRLDDRLAMSVKIRGLADPGATGDRAKDQRNAALGLLMQLLTWAGGERTDGFVTRDVVELFGTTAATARLLRARFDLQPLLHQLDEKGRPPKCPCLDGREWKKDFEYLIHDYLDRNPSRAENDVQRAKARELKNAALKESVRLRDADTCRYCGIFCKHSDRVSDHGLTFDHVDPEVAAGMDNLVVACRGCNNRKGKRTPGQADMVLRPAPTPRPTSGPKSDPGPDTGAGVGPGATPDPSRGTDPSPDQCPTQATVQLSISPGRDGAGSGTGRVVSLPLGPPPARFTGRPPSPYLKPTRDPELHAGHPPQTGEAT